MDSHAKRVAENEMLFRHVNEQIRTLDHRFGVDGAELQTFLCECGRTDCVEPLELTMDEYEEVHANGAQFVIVDGHEDPAVETVVLQTERFTVIKKDEGGPAEYIAEHAPAEPT
jgi:hypothetical protein